MSYIPAQETIAFQYKPKLGELLTDFFQSIIDFRDKIAAELETKTDLAPSQNFEYLVYTLTDFIIKQRPVLLQILSSQLNMRFDRLQLIGGLDSKPTDNLAILFTVSQELFSVIRSMRGIVRTPNDAIKDLATIFDNIDTATVRSNIDPKLLMKHISFTLFLDVNTCFLAPWIMPGTSTFTARELTAIYLHEIGHVFTVLEQCCQTYADALSLRRDIDLLKQSEYPVVVAQDLNKNLAPVIKRLRLSAEKEFKRTTATILRDLDMIPKLADGSDQEDNIFTVLGTAVNVVLEAIHGLGVIFTGHFIVAELEEALTGEKTSDTTNTTWNLKAAERKADEFCARFGYAADLATAIRKLMVIIRSPQAGFVYVNRNKGLHRLDGILLRLQAIAGTVDLRSYVDPEAYENDYRRTESLLTDIYGYFKQSELKKADIQHWLQTVEKIKEVLYQQRTLTVKSPIAKAIYNVMRALLNPGRWWELLRTGGLHSDMDLLSRQLRQLNNNPLYYLADKLQH